MDIPANIKVPEYVYHFYQSAAKNIANQTTEQIMADALSAYAGLLSEEVAKERENTLSEHIQVQPLVHK